MSSVYGVTDYGVSQLAFKCSLLQNLDVSYCNVVSNIGLQAFLNKEGPLALTELRVKNCHKVGKMYTNEEKCTQKVYGVLSNGAKRARKLCSYSSTVL